MKAWKWVALGVVALGVSAFAFGEEVKAGRLEIVNDESWDRTIEEARDWWGIATEQEQFEVVKEINAPGERAAVFRVPVFDVFGEPAEDEYLVVWDYRKGDLRREGSEHLRQLPLDREREIALSFFDRLRKSGYTERL